MFSPPLRASQPPEGPGKVKRGPKVSRAHTPPTTPPQCAKQFEQLDADNSGVLEPQEACPPIVAMFQVMLPDEGGTGGGAPHPPHTTLQSIPIAGPPPTVQQCLTIIASEFDQGGCVGDVRQGRASI